MSRVKLYLGPDWRTSVKMLISHKIIKLQQTFAIEKPQLINGSDGLASACVHLALVEIDHVRAFGNRATRERGYRNCEPTHHQQTRNISAHGTKEKVVPYVM
ncbi:hypothetical protein CEXT_569221 [Caerostris extrusa]|uniref:Uncharacterized protein n=1 Tax=Caerostris extrusa TaxID=172846 RepID=A0AAV4WQ63_CAEEX|nr:hypothetical protein CEXT_569221 [Caerostris extrusa]